MGREETHFLENNIVNSLDFTHQTLIQWVRVVKILESTWLAKFRQLSNSLKDEIIDDVQFFQKCKENKKKLYF